MALALATPEGVGDKANDREAVRAQLVKNTKDRKSALGVYSIDENGDTMLTDTACTPPGRHSDVRGGDQGPSGGSRQTRTTPRGKLVSGCAPSGPTRSRLAETDCPDAVG
jgi:hypothetical protein